MTGRDALGAGVLAATVAAGMAITQNQVQITRSGRDLPAVQQGTVSDATGASAVASTTSARAAFVDTERLALNRIDDGAYASGLLFYNPHCAEETVSMAAEVFDRNNDPLPVRLEIDRVSADGSAPLVAPHRSTSEQWTIPSGGYDRARVKLVLNTPTSAPSPALLATVWKALISAPMDYGTWSGRLPAKGVLILTLHTPATDPETKVPCPVRGTVPSSVKRAIVLQPPLPSPVDTGVLLGSMVLALATTLIVAAVVFRSTKLFLQGRMGEVSFEFKNSWGANVAIGAGLLTALTGGTVLSQEQYSSNSTSYLVLASLFTAMVPLGAALYGLIRPPAKLAVAGSEPQGYVHVYLASSAIVLWGAFGQLVLLGMVLRELALARVLSPESSGLLILMTKLMIAVLGVYAVISALATVESASAKANAEGKSTPRPSASMV